MTNNYGVVDPEQVRQNRCRPVIGFREIDAFKQTLFIRLIRPRIGAVRVTSFLVITVTESTSLRLAAPQQRPGC